MINQFINISGYNSLRYHLSVRTGLGDILQTGYVNIISYTLKPTGLWILPCVCYSIGYIIIGFNGEGGILCFGTRNIIFFNLVVSITITIPLCNFHFLYAPYLLHNINTAKSIKTNQYNVFYYKHQSHQALVAIFDTPANTT